MPLWGDGGTADGIQDGISGVKVPVDNRSAAPLLRILMLMAVADGVLATEEKSMLDKLSKEYLNHSEVNSWESVFSDSMDLEHVAQTIAAADRPLAAKLAYMVISSSREDYCFPVNSAERKAFDRLTHAFELTELQKDQAMKEAIHELGQQAGFWEVLMKTFGYQFMLDMDANPMPESPC